MKKNVIAIVAAVALVLLAVPTIAFANGMQQTWCPSGGAGSLAHHAMRAAGDSDAGATPSSLRPVSIAISAADRSSKDSPTMDFSLMLI